MTKVQADNINGIVVVKCFDGVVLSEDCFYQSLKDNADDSVICAELSDEIFAKIDDEYGIVRLF